MKKIVTFLTISLLFLNTTQAETQQCYCTQVSQQAISILNSECTQAFINGAAVGAVAGFSVDFLLPSFKKFTETWNIPATTGICRDQLAGEAKVATAALGLTALNKATFTNFKLMGAQLVGIIVGACAASYVTKLLTPAATPAPQVQ